MNMEIHSPSDRSAPSCGSTPRIDRTSDGAREQTNDHINLGRRKQEGTPKCQINLRNRKAVAAKDIPPEWVEHSNFGMQDEARLAALLIRKQITDDLLQSALRDQSIANLSGIDEAMDIMRHVVEWLRKAVDRQQGTAAPAVKTESPWQWWAGKDEEWCTIGPEDTREAIIQAATGDLLGECQDDGGTWQLSFHIVEARQDPLRLADWIVADELLNRAEKNVADSDRTLSEHDDGPSFECSPEQEKDLDERIKRACDEWQAAHGLVFACSTFSHTRNSEHITVDHPANAKAAEGPANG